MFHAPPGSLQQAVRRAHIRLALVAMLTAGVLLLVSGLLTLRSDIEDHLRLMARSLVYNVEGALVFGDKPEAMESIERLARGEGVAQVIVHDHKGQIFAQWKAKQEDSNPLGQWVAQSMGLSWAQQDVMVDGERIGSVALLSNGQSMQTFLYKGLVVLLGCMLVSVIVGRIMARRMLHSIVTPLQDLGKVARAVHRDRSMSQRVPLAEMDELRELGEHFNALLEELEARQLHLQQENLALEHKAYHDGLTGMYNRVYFELRGLSALREAAMTGQELAILFMDNDRFKQVNDTYGHGVGDQLLVEVAHRIKSQVRDADVVARLGGDEFVVLLWQPGGREAVEHIASKIQAAVAAPMHARADDGSDVLLSPSVSIGIAMYPEHGGTLEALLQMADREMYAHKLARRRHAEPVTQGD